MRGAVQGSDSPLRDSGAREKSGGRRFTLTQAAWTAVVIALALVGLTLEGVGTMSTITSIFLFVALAQSWNLLGGYGGYLNLGMAAFFGIGAYTTGVLFHHFGWSPWLTMWIGGLASALFALFIGIPSLRIRGPYFAILTLIITFLVRVAVYNLDFTRGALGIFLQPLALPPRHREQVFYFSFLTLAVAAVAVAWWVERRSRLGNALVAVREDEDAAEVLGVDTTRVKMTAFLLGAGIAGVVGGLYAYRLGYIEPEGTFAVSISINVVLMTIVGGAGTWQGPVLGVPLVMGLAEVLRVGVTRLSSFATGLPNEVNRLVFGLLLMLVALYVPRGLMGLVRRQRGRRLKV